MLFGFLPFSPNSVNNNSSSSNKNKNNKNNNTSKSGKKKTGGNSSKNKSVSTRKGSKPSAKLSSTSNSSGNKRKAPRSPKVGPKSPPLRPKSPNMRPKSPQMRGKSPRSSNRNRNNKSNNFNNNNNNNGKNSKNRKEKDIKEKDKDKEKEKEKSSKKESLSMTANNKDILGMEKKICKIGFKASVKASNGAWFPKTMAISAELRQLITSMLKNDAINARWPAKQCYFYLGNLINVKNISKHNKTSVELKEKLKCWLCDKKEQITNFDYKIGMCGKCVRQTRNVNDFLSNLFNQIDNLNDNYWHNEIYQQESKYTILNDWQKLNKLKHINIDKWHDSESGHTLLTFAASKNMFHCVKFLLKRNV